MPIGTIQVRTTATWEDEMKHFRWTDWLAAAAVVMALGAVAAADDLEPTTSLHTASTSEV